MNDESYKSIEYLLVGLIASAATSRKSQYGRLWIAIDGHVKSFEPISDIFEAQLKQCYQEGVAAKWPVSTSCVYQRQSFNWIAGEQCHLHLCIACTYCDQPAAILINGHGHYSAIHSCRVCGSSWCGTTSQSASNEAGALYVKRSGRVKSKAKSQSELTVAELKQELQRRGLPV